MKSFKEMFFEANTANDGLNPEEYIYNFQNKWIICSGHGKAQKELTKRIVPNKKKNELFKKAIKYIQKKGKENKTYIFLMIKSEIGMTIEYRKDKEKKVEGLHLIIITWYGYLKNLDPPKTIDTFYKKFDLDILVKLEQIGINKDNVIFVELEENDENNEY